jgi:hypothetical protein
VEVAIHTKDLRAFEYDGNVPCVGLRTVERGILLAAASHVMQQPVAVEELHGSADRYDDHAGHEYALFLVHFCRLRRRWRFRANWDTVKRHNDIPDSIGGGKHQVPGFFFFATQILINRHRKRFLFHSGS